VRGWSAEDGGGFANQPLSSAEKSSYRRRRQKDIVNHIKDGHLKNKYKMSVWVNFNQIGR